IFISEFSLRENDFVALVRRVLYKTTALRLLTKLWKWRLFAISGVCQKYENLIFSFAMCHFLNFATLPFVNYEQLKLSIELIEKIINVYENDYIPTFKFKGPLYLSKYDLYWDPKIYPDVYTKIEAIQIYTDGKRSILEIADLVDLDFEFVLEFYKTIEKIEF
ncbi:MAG: hypothetical protein ACK5LY_06160, partial [Lachnospirales bacterium]